MIDANDGGVDITGNGGADLVRAAAADLAVLPRRGRHASPYHVAGAMQDLGTAQGPSNSLNERHPPDRLARRRRRRSRATSLRPERPEHRLCRRVRRHHHALRPPDRRVAQRQRLARQPVGHRRRGHEVPLPVDRADRRFAARPEGRLPRRARLFRTRDGGQTLGGDQPRPDAQRQVEAEVVRRADHRRQHRRRDYCTIFAIAESPKQKGLIWAGSDDGLVHVTTRRRQELEERDRGDAGLARVGHGQHDRAVAVRRRHRLRRRRRAPARRPAPVPLQDDRFRQDLEAPRRRRCRRTSTCTPSARIRRSADSSISAPSAA